MIVLEAGVLGLLASAGVLLLVGAAELVVIFTHECVVVALDDQV